MRCHAIRTDRFEPGESLCPFILRYIPQLPHGSIIAVTSKLLSLSQGRCCHFSNTVEKWQWMQEASDWADPHDHRPWQLTLTGGLLSIAGGIDESNTPQTLLPPHNSMENTASLWRELVCVYGHTHLGIIITDSFIHPLKQGVIGVTMAWSGFDPIHDYRGQPDLYGRTLQTTTVNIADLLASVAVLEMGEGAEQQPLAIIEELNTRVHFTHHAEADLKSRLIRPEHDIFRPWLPETLKKTASRFV